VVYLFVLAGLALLFNEGLVAEIMGISYPAQLLENNLPSVRRALDAERSALAAGQRRLVPVLGKAEAGAQKKEANIISAS